MTTYKATAPQSGIEKISTSYEQIYEPKEFTYTQNMPTYDGSITVRENSMWPKLENGDIVLYKNLKSRRCGLFGEMYVVAYVLGGEEHVVITYVHESTKPGYYTLKSANPDYSSWDIPRDSVRQLALIKASIRFHTMG